jgi:hypothetical protein
LKLFRRSVPNKRRELRELRKRENLWGSNWRECEYLTNVNAVILCGGSFTEACNLQGYLA